uniref:Uncharacterized protein n=1 Tax=Meloidogyne enterolobii TaxID=390850 RepID=A0A6V7UNI8_MELEN|nr:unnamed protein product [Meloidogyne enterolobii]
MTDESKSQLKETNEESLSKIWKETKYPLESTNPLILKKEQLEKALNKIKEKKKNEENVKIFEEEDFLKFLKAKIKQKRDERPKFKRAQEARFSSGKIWISPPLLDWEGKLNEEIVENLFKNLPKMLKHVEVTEEAVNMVLVLDEINRVLEYETAINEIECALEDEEEKKMKEEKMGNEVEKEEKDEEKEEQTKMKEEKGNVRNEVMKKGKDEEEKIKEEQGKRKMRNELVKDEQKKEKGKVRKSANYKREKCNDGKGRLNHLWLKLNLYGILNITGPGDNVDERLKEGLERLTKANDFVNLLDEENQYRMEFEVGVENCKNLLNRAAKILDRFNNFRTSYFRPGSVLDKYKVIDDDKKVKNKKEIYIDKQPSIKIKEDNWLEEALKNLRKEREKELKHIMKSEIFSGNTLIVNKTVDWSKEYNANFVVEMLSRQSLPLPQETLEKLAVELVLVLDEAQRVSDYETEISKIENAIQEIKQSGKHSKNQRLNRHLLKFVLWGILNIEGPNENLEEKIALAFERLHTADEFIKLYGVKDSGRIQVEKCVKDAEDVLNRAIVLIKFFDNFRGGATADEKKTEQITSQINVKKGFDEGEG